MKSSRIKALWLYTRRGNDSVEISRHYERKMKFLKMRSLRRVFREEQRILQLRAWAAQRRDDSRLLALLVVSKKKKKK